MPSISKDIALEKNKVPPPPPPHPGHGQECQEFTRKKIKASTLSNFFSKVKRGRGGGKWLFHPILTFVIPGIIHEYVL